MHNLDDRLKELLENKDNVCPGGTGKELTQNQSFFRKYSKIK
jgi:hypothetical protein